MTDDFTVHPPDYSFDEAFFTYYADNKTYISYTHRLDWPPNRILWPKTIIMETSSGKWPYDRENDQSNVYHSRISKKVVLVE